MSYTSTWPITYFIPMSVFFRAQLKGFIQSDWINITNKKKQSINQISQPSKFLSAKQESCFA
jgi:hypothetical protein